MKELSPISVNTIEGIHGGFLQKFLVLSWHARSGIAVQQECVLERGHEWHGFCIHVYLSLNLLDAVVSLAFLVIVTSICA